MEGKHKKEVVLWNWFRGDLLGETSVRFSMKIKPQIAVIGLGKFGYKFGMTLLNLGYNVLGIDYQQYNIDKAKKNIHPSIRRKRNAKTST